MTFHPPEGNPVQSPPRWAPVTPPGGSAAPPAAAYPPPYPPPGYPSTSPSSKSNATKWIIGGLVAFVVVALVGVAWIVALTRSGSGDKAGDTVQAYLQALSKADAAKALTYGAGSPDRRSC